MVIRKAVKATVERMGRFEAYELGCAQSLYGSQGQQEDPLAEILQYIIEKRYVHDPGGLAALFEAYLVFTSERRGEEDGHEEVSQEKYGRYLMALEERFAYPTVRGKAEDYLEREAFYYIFKRDVNGSAEAERELQCPDDGGRSWGGDPVLRPLEGLADLGRPGVECRQDQSNLCPGGRDTGADAEEGGAAAGEG
jgi:hypothetical protein